VKASDLLAGIGRPGIPPTPNTPDPGANLGLVLDHRGKVPANVLPSTTFLQAVSSSALSLTNTFQAVSGCTANFNVYNAGATISIVGRFDLDANGVTGNGVLIGQLLVDGAQVGNLALLTDVAATTRATVIDLAVGSLAVGAHVLSAAARKTGGAGSGACQSVILNATLLD
jgi:hypothetical protein